MGLGKFFGTHLGDLGSRSLSYQSATEFTCPHHKVRTAHPINPKLDTYISLTMFSTWFNFEVILSKTFFCEFLHKISNAFLLSRAFYLPYLRNGWSNWCETNRKWVNWVLRWLGCLWPWPLTLTFDLEFSWSNCILGMGGPFVMEWKGLESIGCPDVKH